MVRVEVAVEAVLRREAVEVILQAAATLTPDEDYRSRSQIPA